MPNQWNEHIQYSHLVRLTNRVISITWRNLYSRLFQRALKSADFFLARGSPLFVLIVKTGELAPTRITQGKALGYSRLRPERYESNSPNQLHGPTALVSIFEEESLAPNFFYVIGHLLKNVGHRFVLFVQSTLVK